MARPLLHHVEKGTGLSVVLLHGFPLDRRVWAAQQDELSKNYRVITPDLAGFGASKGRGPFTLEQQADDVHALLEKIGALPCVLGGLSMGGYVTLAYWKKYAATLKGLIFVDTKATADTSDGKSARDKMIALVIQSGSTAVADQMMPRMLTPMTISHRPEIHDDLREIMEACSAVTIGHALAAMRDRPDFDCDLPSIAEPTLVIVGEADPIIPLEVAQKMQAGIPNSKLVVIPDASHMATIERPTEVTTAIREFLGTLG